MNPEIEIIVVWSTYDNDMVMVVAYSPTTD